MGDFSDITCVATYIARMGQCFSKSKQSVNIFDTDVDDYVENDIKSANGKYCFSDGIGKVSPDLAKTVSKDMNLAIISFYITMSKCLTISDVDWIMNVANWRSS